MAQKAIEMLRAAVLKSETKEGLEELSAERKRAARAGMSKTAEKLAEWFDAEAGNDEEGEGGRKRCSLCERYWARTAEGLCECCDLAESRERLRHRREQRAREQRGLGNLSPSPKGCQVSGDEQQVIARLVGQNERLQGEVIALRQAVVQREERLKELGRDFAALEKVLKEQ